MGSEGDQTWKAMSAFLFFQEESKIFFFFLTCQILSRLGYRKESSKLHLQL